MVSQVKAARCKMAVLRAVFSKLSNGGLKKIKKSPPNKKTITNRIIAASLFFLLIDLQLVKLLYFDQLNCGNSEN